MTSNTKTIEFLKDIIGEVLKFNYLVYTEFPNFAKLFYFLVISLVIYKILKFLLIKSLNVMKLVLKLVFYSGLIFLVSSFLLKSPVQVNAS